MIEHTPDSGRVITLWGDPIVDELAGYRRLVVGSIASVLDSLSLSAFSYPSLPHP